MMKHALLQIIAPWLIGIAIVVALSVSGAFALTTPAASAGPGQYGVSITSVTALTVPTFAASAEICVVGAAASYTDDGSTPTTSVGIPVAAGQCFAYSGPLSAFKIIGATGATLSVSYYK
ncbi:MAG TPA: hypothetical protein VFE60_10155 [Roseiarcus sp.]|jgi:hypothetical protein|nr:hypothetical protein [Roseiarcus sp.]